MNPKERKEHRRQRLGALIEAHFKGSQALFAERAGVDATLVSRYMSGLKGIGEAMRDKIERNTGFLGWFDSDRPVKQAAPLRHSRKLVQRLCDIAETIDDIGLKRLIMAAEDMARLYPLASKHKKKKAA